MVPEGEHLLTVIVNWREYVSSVSLICVRRCGEILYCGLWQLLWEQYKKPPTGWAAFRQQNTPGARNCSFSGVSVLPVNPAAGIPALGYASRDRVRSEVAVTESFRRGVFAFL